MALQPSTMQSSVLSPDNIRDHSHLNDSATQLCLFGQEVKHVQKALASQCCLCSALCWKTTLKVSEMRGGYLKCCMSLVPLSHPPVTSYFFAWFSFTMIQLEARIISLKYVFSGFHFKVQSCLRTFKGCQYDRKSCILDSHHFEVWKH